MTAPATLPSAVQVDGPGIYDLPAAEYHARPELSSSGARKLLSPSCPALFKHAQDNPEPTRKVWEVGTAAHKLVLGVGPQLVLVDRPRWDTNDIKAELAEIRQAGNVPLKRPEYDAVHAMAEQIRQHPIASRLFSPETGRGEQTLIWRDKETGVDCRALVDWLRWPTAGRYFLPDYKTCLCAAPDKLGRIIADHGYHVQLAWYSAGIKALGIADDPKALLVMQEKTAPYLVTVSEPDPAAMRMGEIRMREALRLFAECQASDVWPGYSDDVVLTELPSWETRELNGVTW